MEEAPTRGRIDGGRQAWAVTFGGFWALFVTFGWINSLGVLQTYYETELLREYSPSTIAWIASVQQCLMYSGGAMFGKMFDNYGARVLVAGGGALHVFGLFMTSVSSRYYQVFLAQAVCSAIGCSAMFHASLGAIATWFDKRRGTAYGIIASGASIGGVIFPVAVDRLIYNIGFPWTMRVVAFIVLFGAVLAALTVTANGKRNPATFHFREYLRPLRDAKFVLLSTALMVFGFGLFVPINFLVSAARADGMSVELSIYTIAILNGTSCFGRILPGLLADKFGRLNMIIICTAATGIGTLAIWIPGRGNAATICFAAFFGFFSGGYVSLTPAVSAELSPLRDVGLRGGMLYFFISLGVLAGSPIGGALIDADNGKYLDLKIFAGTVMCAGAALTVALHFFSTSKKSGESGQEKTSMEMRLDDTDEVDGVEVAARADPEMPKV